MKRTSIVSIALLALVGSAVGLDAAEKVPAPDLTIIPVAAGNRPQAIVSGPDGAAIGHISAPCPSRKNELTPIS
jgi:hypothetical protein